MRKLMLTIFIIVSIAYTAMAKNEYCYSYKHIILPADSELVESIFKNSFQVKKKGVQIEFRVKETLFFYNGILFRIEIKNRMLNCPYEKGYYFEDDIKVYYNPQNNSTYITSLQIWHNLIVGK